MGKIPQIPDPTSAQFSQMIKQWIEVAEGVRGPAFPLDRAVKVKDLIDPDFINKLAGYEFPITKVPPDYGYIGDESAPRPPTNLQVTNEVFRNILTWDDPTSDNFWYIEVFRAKVPAGDPAPTVVDAIKIASVPKTVETFIDTEIFVTSYDYYYWIRAVSYAGVASLWQDGYIPGDETVGGMIDSIMEILKGADPAAWSSIVNYVVDDRVLHADKRYKCILANLNQEPPNTTYWERSGILITGEVGGVPTVGVDGNLIVDGTILARCINVDDAFIGATIQSTVFTPGSAGWQINKNGDVEFNSGVFRGTTVWENIDGVPALPSDEHLVGYWALDDGSGAVAVDGSGNGNDGTLNGFPATNIYGQYDFLNSADGWVGTNLTITENAHSITINATANDPQMAKSGLSVVGGDHFLITVRIKRIAGATWDGRLFYSTSGHGGSASYYKSFSQPSNFSEYQTIEIDMRDLTAGGDDWINNTITELRFDFGAGADDDFEIDYIKIGRNIWVDGVVGKCLELDGINEYIEIPYNALLAPTSEIGFGAWAYQDDWSSALAEMYLLSKTQAGGYRLGFNAPGYAVALLRRNSAYGSVAFDHTSLSSGWHFFFVTYDGRYLKLYVDGELKDTDDAGANYPIQYTCYNSLIIGAEAGGAAAPSGNYYNNKVDESRIYAVAPTANGIKALYLYPAGSGSTKISAGKITISGATSLSDWRQGGDTTKIAGGYISANTISANKISIGSRNVIFDGIAFSANKDTNNIAWTAGTVSYINDAGSVTSADISSGNQTCSSGTYYFYWVKDATTISNTTNRGTAYAADNLVIASYVVTTQHLIVTYAKTIIDGSDISCDNLSAISANLGSITAGTITMSNTGWIKGGQTAYATGTGFFLGCSGAAYKFSIGSSTKYLKWDGSDLSIGGDIIATGNIKANAISTKGSGTNATTTMSTTSSWVDLITVNINLADGSNILCLGKIGEVSAAGPAVCKISIRITRGGTEVTASRSRGTIWSGIDKVSISSSVMDSTTAGAKVYKLQYYRNAGDHNPVANNNTLTIIEFKK